MLGLGLPEIVVIFVIILFLFGARRLPAIGEGLGKTLKELRGVKAEKKTDGEKKVNKEKKEEALEGNLITDLKKEVDELPGVQEAKEIKEMAKSIKDVTKFLK
jgi:sec-independent protein translocase protein TatA